MLSLLQSAISRLAERDARPAAAKALATELGATDLVLFVRVSSSGSFVPAIGFPKTLPNGRAWQAFIRRCAETGNVEAGELPYPDSERTQIARGLASNDAAAIFLGGALDRDHLAQLRASLPLLAAVFRAELQGASDEANAKLARSHAERAETLTTTLAASQADLHRTLRDLHASRELLGTTLKSIGDAVISTDIGGIVTFMNEVAESLTGWKSDEARGQPIAEIFPLLDEKSRSAAENPIVRALRENRIVGLANHTLLVQRDGAEIPIDDSAAPIRDGSGDLVGAVVVFRDVSDRRAAEIQLHEQQQLAQLAAAVGRALTRHAPLHDQLRGCVESVVEQLDAAFARIWTVGRDGSMLELRASAGMYTHLDGPHGRVPVGSYKIGLIAQEREPHLTNSVQTDARVGDRDWANREGMIAFAGYPLLVDGLLVGVIALFSRRPLSGRVLDALAAIADQIAVGILRETLERQRDEAIAKSQRHVERLRALAAASLEITKPHAVQALLQTITDRARELIGAHQAVASMTVIEDRAQALMGLSLSDKYAAWRTYGSKPDGSGIYTQVCKHSRAMRLTQSELEAHPGWRGFGAHRADHPPMRGWLALPLVARDGRSLGLIQLSDKYEGDFTEEDEAIALQLAQLASAALENATLVEELAASVRAREKVLAIVSHDLRNPLNSIILSAGLLAEMLREGPDKAQSYVTRIQTSSERMERLIADLLDFARIEEGQLAIVRATVEARALVMEAFQSQEVLATKNGIGLRLDLAELPAETCVEGDRERILQVFANLVGNAIKFTPREGSITLGGHARGGAVAFFVTDSGPGIDPVVLPMIFEAYKQAPDTARLGLGLGLFIAKGIVEAHGGKIAVESTLGAGATFWFELPRS